MVSYFYAKFRCGVAPLKIETGRHGVDRVPAEERFRYVMPAIV